MKTFYPLYLLSTLALSCVMAAEGSDVAGTWHGESLCATDALACHNEKVVYYIKEVPDRPDVVTIQADKIIDGKAITMGTGEWQHDRAQHTLEWRSPRQVWLLKINGNRIDGTLMLADKTVFRKMSLTRDE
ncbi:MAG TPA: hypothetical protein VK335_16200 [Bryobacteraceae bacterium]|nr:hypothetical protein [Bryobacteraceae bacterium]